jgi:hypothetical protein
MKAPLLSLFTTAATFGTLVVAQTNVPPPLTRAQEDQRRSDAIRAVGEGAAVAYPGAGMKAHVILDRATGGIGTSQKLVNAGLADEFIGKTYGVGKVVVGTVKDGGDGFMREGVQFVIDQGTSEAIDYGIKKYALPRLVLGGASGASAFGAVGLSFTGGTLIGTYIRESTGVGKAVDDWWFDRAPDSLKEWASGGVKQVDFDSPAYQAKMQADIERISRQRAFDRVAAENQQQRLQMEAANAAAAATNAVANAQAPEPSGPNPSTLFLDSLNQTLLQYGQLRTAGKSTQTPPAACTPAKTLDPKTGCHPGHDEGNHPGGCKCG